MSQMVKVVKTLEQLNELERWIVVGKPVVEGRKYRVPVQFLSFSEFLGADSKCACKRTQREAVLHARGEKSCCLNPKDENSPWKVQLKKGKFVHLNCGETLFTEEELLQFGTKIERKKSSRRIIKPSQG